MSWNKVFYNGTVPFMDYGHPMWQTEYASAVLKNLGVGGNVTATFYNPRFTLFSYKFIRC